VAARSRASGRPSSARAEARCGTSESASSCLEHGRVASLTTNDLPFPRSPSLTEWDPKWFRLFVSDVSNDCTEKVLTEAFSKYPSFKKTKVIKDRLSNKVRSRIKRPVPRLLRS
jgi:RNA recognition motif-containing protein